MKTPKLTVKRLRAELIYLSLIFLSASSLCFYLSVSEMWTAYESKYWIETRAIIVTSKMNEACDDDSKYSNCLPSIEYQYIAEGRTIAGDDITAGSNDPTRRNEAEDKLQRYPVGKSVAAFYDPNNHVSACLEPGVPDPSAYILFVFGIFFVGTYIWIVNFAIKLTKTLLVNRCRR